MRILIIDNGSQYTHLIKRSYHDLGHEAEVINTAKKYDDAARSIDEADAIVLSGGPKSVYLERQETLSRKITVMVRDGVLTKPLFGICYGHQMIGYVFGARVDKGAKAEYGIAEILVDDEDVLFKGLPKRFRAWVSHYDEVKGLPPDFTLLAHSDSCMIEAMKNEKLPVYSVQFHPEVWHTENGEAMLKNFLDAVKR